MRIYKTLQPSYKRFIVLTKSFTSVLGMSYTFLFFYRHHGVNIFLVYSFSDYSANRDVIAMNFLKPPCYKCWVRGSYRQALVGKELLPTAAPPRKGTVFREQSRHRNTQAKGGVLATKAAKTQAKGGVLTTKAAKHTGDRRCPCARLGAPMQAYGCASSPSPAESVGRQSSDPNAGTASLPAAACLYSPPPPPPPVGRKERRCFREERRCLRGRKARLSMVSHRHWRRRTSGGGRLW